MLLKKMHCDKRIVHFSGSLIAATLLILTLPALTSAQTWEPLGPSGGTVIGSVSDPTNADVITVVTDYPAPSFVYRSLDGGATWNQIGEVPYYNLSDFCAYDSSRLYAVISFRCYYSTDGGTSWSFGSWPVSSGYARSVCVHPTDPSKVYAAGVTKDSGATTYYLAFFSSTDGGATWSATSHFAFENLTIYDMAVSRSNPDVIYVCGYYRIGGIHYTAMFKSDDGGATWSDISSLIEPLSSQYIYTVEVDPLDENRVYAGGYNFYCSTDGGLSWTKDSSHYYTITDIGIDPINTNNLYLACTYTVYTSTDYGLNWTAHPGAIEGEWPHIEVAPAMPSTIHIANRYGGFYRSTDSGATWKEAHEGIFAHEIASMAVSPSHPETLYVDLFDCADLVKSEDSGNTWQNVTYPLGCGSTVNALNVNAMDNEVVMALERSAGGKCELFRSKDGGSVWTSMDDFMDTGDCIAATPYHAETVYYGGRVYHSANATYQMAIVRSKDGGASWPDRILLGSESNNYTACWAVAVAATDPLIVYAGGLENSIVKLYRTSDGGNTWIDATGNLVILHPQNHYINGLWVSPENPDHVVAGTTFGVFHTSDGGLTWTETSITTGTVDFAYHPAIDTLYAATLLKGVFRSEDRGVTWQAMNDGLDVLRVRCLDVDTKNGFLYAGTKGGSVWRLDVPASPLWVDFLQVPATTGNTVTFHMDASTANIGRDYLLVGGLTGTSPGYGLPGGLVSIPVNFDTFTYYIVLPHLNSPLFAEFLGALDVSGLATAQLNAPPVPGFDGVPMYYAYCLNNPFDYVSNPVMILITP